MFGVSANCELTFFELLTRRDPGPEATFRVICDGGCRKGQVFCPEKYQHVNDTITALWKAEYFTRILLTVAGNLEQYSATCSVRCSSR